MRTAKRITEGNFAEKSSSMKPVLNSITIQKLTYTNPPVRFHAPMINCRINKVMITRTHVEIHMMHQANPMYANGGWVRLHPEIFIRPSFSNQHLALERAEGIPIYPDEHYYKREHDSIQFKLFFPPVPIDTEMLDVVEREPSDDSWFNFYGITLDICTAEIE